MKRILAILLVAVFFIVPVLAGFEEDANIENVKFTVGKAESAPVLGEFDTSKYTKLEPSAGDMSYAWDDAVDNGLDLAKGLDFEAYVSYDANNIYALIITDTKLYDCDCDDGDGNVWQSSCIQVSAAAADASGTERLEYGIFRNSVNGELGGVVWADSGNTDAKGDYEPEAGKNYTVALKDGKLYYECITPVNTFLGKDTVAEGDVVAFSLVMAQRTEDTYIHTQIASGCTGNGKTAENFMRLTLGAPIAPPVVDEPVIEDDAPAADDGGNDVVVTPPPSTAPQTGDAGIITFAIVMIVAALGVVIIRRKISVK